MNPYKSSLKWVFAEEVAIDRKHDEHGQHTAFSTRTIGRIKSEPCGTKSSKQINMALMHELRSPSNTINMHFVAEKGPQGKHHRLSLKPRHFRPTSTTRFGPNGSQTTEASAEEAATAINPQAIKQTCALVQAPLTQPSKIDPEESRVHLFFSVYGSTALFMKVIGHYLMDPVP